MRRIQQLVDRCSPINDQPAGHAEAQAQQMSRVEIHDEQLAQAASGHKRGSHQLVVQQIGGCTFLEKPVVVRPDCCDCAAHKRLGGLSIDFDLHKLRHPEIVAHVQSESRRSATFRA